MGLTLARTGERADAPPPRRPGAVREPRPEAEVAFLADAAAFRALAALPLAGGPGRLRWTAQRIVHYDTDGFDLRRSGRSLQTRRTATRTVMRLETDDGAVEVTLPAERPQFDLFPDEARERIESALDGRPLKPVFGAELRRARRSVTFEGATVELAFEDGEIAAGARKTPVREISLTLKSGAAASLYRFALALGHEAPLGLATVARSDMGFALATGATARSAKAAPTDFDEDATLDQVIGALLRQGFDHFLANWPALASPDAAEAVHQLRVAMRRLRSLLALLKHAFPSGELEALRADAKRVADAFGQARDWRVFSDMVQAGPAAHLPQVTGLRTLVAAAEAREREGRRIGANTLCDPATVQFVLKGLAFITAHGWRSAASEAGLRALGEPAAPFAAETLERVFRRLKKRARGFETLGAEARHDMRIALKQMRYAVDFFAPLFAREAGLDRFAARASVLQDMLGAANDGAVAAQLLHGLDVSNDPTLAFAAGAALGWSERGGLIDEDALRRAWKKLRAARRFWRDALPAPTPEEEPAA